LTPEEANRVYDKICGCFSETNFWKPNTTDTWKSFLKKQDWDATWAATDLMVDQAANIKAPTIPMFKKWVVTAQQAISRAQSDAYDPAGCDKCEGRRVRIGTNSESFYPCEDCLPGAYVKWTEGHYNSDHAHGCKDCMNDVAKPGGDGSTGVAKPPSETLGGDPISVERFKQFAAHMAPGHNVGLPEDCEVCTADFE